MDNDTVIEAVDGVGVVLTREDADALMRLVSEYENTYTVKWVDAALDFYKDGFYEDAETAFVKARDGFQADANPAEYGVLSTWINACKTMKDTGEDTNDQLMEVSPDVDEEDVTDLVGGDDEDFILRSLITKAEVGELTSDLAGLLAQYENDYAGTHIAAAIDFYQKGFFDDAADSFEKARDAFLPDENAAEYALLDKWTADASARSAAGESIEDVLVEEKSKSAKCENCGCELEDGKCPECDAEKKSVVENEEEVLQIEKGQTIIEKADQACMKKIWGEYYKYYSGKWIATAMKLYNSGKYNEAGQAFTKARDGFQENKNPNEFKCLDAWATDAAGKAKSAK